MDRDCESCKHRKKEVCKDGIFYYSCDLWDCEFEPCEPVENPDQLDCVSRQAVIDALCSDCELYKDGKRTCFTKCEEYHFLTTLPPVSSSEKTGHWIADVDKWGDIVTTVNGYKCSECEMFNAFNDKYCPNCGAKMVEPQERGEKE